MNTGRWIIVREVSAAPRAGECRTRVLCRCVCGTEKVVWMQDLQRGRSSGCESARCRSRHEAVQEIKVMLDQWLSERGLRERLATEEEHPSGPDRARVDTEAWAR